MITVTNIEQRKAHIEALITTYQQELQVLDQLTNLYRTPFYQDVKELEDICKQPASQNGESTHTAIVSIKAYTELHMDEYGIIRITPDVLDISVGTFYRAINIMVAKGMLTKTGASATYKYNLKKD